MSSSSETVPGCSIRVFLLIENRLLREALSRLFRKRSDILLVGQGEQADAAACQVADSRCDILVIDSCELNWLAESIAVERGVKAAFKAILIGMESDEEQFFAAVRGEAVCPPQLCSTLFRFVAQVAREMLLQTLTSRPDLTVRQQQLVALVAKGLTNKEIASRLNLSEFTVRNHIHRILKQVDAETRSKAVDAIRAHGYAI